MKPGAVVVLACTLALVGCGFPPDATQPSKEDAEKAAREKVEKAAPELLKRWNAVAKNTPVDLTGAQPNFGVVTFEWTDFNNFPHPTFKGGSQEAYGGFAKVLVAFLQTDDNLDFLITNDLLTAELKTAVPGGSGKGTGWSFANFVERFSAPDAYGKLDDDTRKAMKTLAARIQPIVARRENRKI